MPKIYPYTSDPITQRFYEEQEAIELFGQECLDEFGMDVTEDELRQLVAARNAVDEAQAVIARIAGRRG